MNPPTIALFIVLVLIAIASSVFGARRKSRDASLTEQPWPLEVRARLLSEPERTLYQRLVQTLPNHIVLAQVHLLQVLEFKRGSRSQSIANSFNQLSLDFLILNRDTSIVAAVELDDSTHARESRRQADARKTHALQSAGVPLIRWTAKSLPDAATILTAIPARSAPSQATS